MEWGRRYSEQCLVGAFFATVCLLSFIHQTQIENPAMVRFGYSAFALTSAFLVFRLRIISGSRDALAIMMRWAPLRSFGKYSYGLYVLHFVLKPIFQHYFSVSLLTDRVFHHYWPARFAFMALSIAASLAVAWLSWHLYEKQFLKLKRFFQPAAVAPVRLSAPQTPLAQAA